MVLSGIAPRFDIDDVHADVVQTNGIAQRFVDTHCIGVEEMNLALTGHLLDVGGGEKKFSGIHISPFWVIT